MVVERSSKVVTLLLSNEGMNILKLEIENALNCLFKIFEPNMVGSFQHFRSIFITLLNCCTDNSNDSESPNFKILDYLVKSERILQLVWNIKSPEICDCLVACFVFTRSKDIDSKAFFEGLLECEFIPLLFSTILGDNQVLHTCGIDVLSRIIITTKDLKNSESMFMSVYVTPEPEIKSENNLNDSCHASNPIKVLCSKAATDSTRCDSYIELIHTLILSKSVSSHMINAVRISGNSIFGSGFFKDSKSSVMVMLVEIYSKVIPCSFEVPWDCIIDVFLNKLKNSSIFQVAVSLSKIIFLGC